MPDINTSPAAFSAPPEAKSDLDALFDVIGPVAGAHVAVIGTAGLEVMCGLIRRGCAAAAEMPLHDRAAAESAEIVVIPCVASLAAAMRAVAQARRVLADGGRIVLREPSGLRAAEMAALLRTSGFSGVRARVLASGTILSADLPFFGQGGFGRLARA